MDSDKKSPELIITVGLPGSGKSTWARQQDGYVIVNRDSLRVMMHSGRPWSKEQEKLTRAARDSIIMLMLKKGQSVISDDTNFGQIGWTKNLADQAGAIYRVVYFTHVPVEVCIERDSKREGPAHVGEEVIRSMAERNGLLPEDA